jgi:hypothetical protein
MFPNASHCSPPAPAPPILIRQQAGLTVRLILHLPSRIVLQSPRNA